MISLPRSPCRPVVVNHTGSRQALNRDSPIARKEGAARIEQPEHVLRIVAFKEHEGSLG